MSARLVNVDRNTPMFLPCDLREWVPTDHMVHFILDAIEQIPTGHFHVNHRGTGSEQYPPAMMLALLIYGYATGRSSSRMIEAASYSDVAVRYLCANVHPDHDSICTFRRENQVAIEAAFVKVLQWARELKLARVGTISVDGNKPKGKEPQPPSPPPEAKAQHNFTDPESRIMKAGSSGHFEQAYNAPAAVDENMLIVGAEVSQAPNDKEQLTATLAVVALEVKPEIKAVLVDSGFYSEAAVQAVEQKPDGTPTGVTVSAAVERVSHHRSVEDLVEE